MKRKILFNSFDWIINNDFDNNYMYAELHYIVRTIRNNANLYIIAYKERISPYNRIKEEKNNIYGSSKKILNTIFSDFNNIKIEKLENGNIQITTYDHDSYTKIIIRNITKKGYKWCLNNSKMNKEDIIKHLTNTTGYTSRINIKVSQ